MPELRLADDTVKVVLNTKGKTGEVSDDLKALLRYIGGHRPESPLTKELDEEVEKVKRSDEYVLELIENNPDASDADIAKMLMAAENGN